MKSNFSQRMLALLICLLMTMSLFTVSGFGDTVTAPSLGNINAADAINGFYAMSSLRSSNNVLRDIVFVPAS